MARAFNGSSSRITYSPTITSTDWANGWSLAAIFRPAATGAHGYPIAMIGSGGQSRWALMLASGTTPRYDINDSGYTPSSFPSVSAGNWYCFVATKPSGVGVARLHWYNYATNTWTHADTSSSATPPTGDVASIQIGSNSILSRFFNGDIAAAAAFARPLDDATCESLAHTLNSWLSADPFTMFVLDQSVATQAVKDWTGRYAGPADTATSISTNSVPILGYGHPVIVPTRQAGAPSSAATSTLTDNFDDNTINTAKWPQNYGTVAETGGRARVTCNSGASAFVSASNYSLDSVHVQAYPATTGSVFGYSMLGFGPDESNRVSIYYQADTGDLVFERYTADVRNTTALTYSSTAHAWWRLALSAGNMLWQTSPDGTTWTTRRTETAPAWLPGVTAGYVKLEGYRDSGSDLFEADNLNVAAPTANGTVAAALPTLGAAASGTATATGAAAAGLPALTASAAGAASATGTAAANLPSLGAAAAGTVRAAGTAALGLPALQASTSGTASASGNSATTLPALTGQAIGTATATGSVSTSLPALQAAAAGAISASGTASISLPALAGSAAGAASANGTAAAALPAFTGQSAGTVRSTGTAALPLPALGATTTGTASASGTATANLPPLGVSAAGTVLATASITAGLPAMLAAAVGTVAGATSGGITATLPALTGTAAGTASSSATAAAGLPALTGQAAGTMQATGAAAAPLPALTASAAGAVGSAPAGTIGITLPPLGTAGAGQASATATVGAALPALQGSAAGTATASGTASAGLPALTATIVGATAGPITGSTTAALPALVAAANGVGTAAGQAAISLPALTVTASDAPVFKLRPGTYTAGTTRSRLTVGATRGPTYTTGGGT